MNFGLVSYNDVEFTKRLLPETESLGWCHISYPLKGLSWPS